MMLSMIAAMGHDRVIGLDNQMPWHLPADLQWFKRTTLGSPIIMGRKTYDSIGKALPGRLNIILSRNKSLKVGGCVVVNSLEEALTAAIETGASEVFVTGGAHLYEKFLPQTQRLYLTLIDAEFAGDTFFPDYSAYDWREISREDHAADEKNPYPYSFRVLERDNHESKSSEWERY